MVTQILVSAMMAVAPLQPHSKTPELPKEYAVIIPEEEENKTSSRRERRANKRRKK